MVGQASLSLKLDRTGPNGTILPAIFLVKLNKRRENPVNFFPTIYLADALTIELSQQAPQSLCNSYICVHLSFDSSQNNGIV